MSKQLVKFTGVLFMLAAILAVSAQENTTGNATMNNTTLLNNTTLNASAIEVSVLPTETADETAPTQVEAIAAQNETVQAQNATMPAAPRPVVVQLGYPQRAVSAIGGGETVPSTLPIDGKALSQMAYEVGLPAKTIMDLSAM